MQKRFSLNALFFLTLFSVTGGAALASGDASPASLCATDFEEPKITAASDGTFFVCTNVPAAYITKEQATAAALKENRQQAREHCKGPALPVGEDEVTLHPLAATALSHFACQ
jgi:hypothetical protein